MLGVGTAQVAAAAARPQTVDDELGACMERHGSGWRGAVLGGGQLCSRSSRGCLAEERDISPPLSDNSQSDRGTSAGLIAGISVLAAVLILVILALIYVQHKRNTGRIDLQDIVASSPRHNNMEDGVTTSAYTNKGGSTRAWPRTLNDSVTSYQQPKLVMSRALMGEDRRPLWFPSSPSPQKTRELSFVQGPAPVSSPGRYADGRLPVYLTEAKQGKRRDGSRFACRIAHVGLTIGWGVLSSPAVKPQVMHVTRHRSNGSQEPLLEDEARPVNMYAL